MGKVNAKFEGSKIVAGFDANQDGENSINLKLNLAEVYGELLAKGEAKVEVKTLNFKVEGSIIKISLDTDKDGDPVLEADIDMLEGFEEVALKIGQ